MLQNLSQRASFTLLSLLMANVICRPATAESPSPLRVGWIGAMSGSVAKYAAYEAAILAQDDVNAAGGINGRKFELIFQDGKCNSRDAITAAHQLIDVEKVSVIVGGHCSSESIPIAQVAEKAKVVMMAAISSSPKLSSAGEYIFRVTAPNTEGVKLLLAHARASGWNDIAVVYEETEYASGLAEYFKSQAPSHAIKVSTMQSFVPGETDFRSIVTRIKASGAKAVYFSPQSPDGTTSVLRAFKEQRIELPVLGNEIAGNTVKANVSAAGLFEGMVFAEPQFDTHNPAVTNFTRRYLARFGGTGLPYGFYTCEAYDAVRVVAHVLATCGVDNEKVKECLYTLNNYQGLSGKIAFDSNGDGIRHYILKKIGSGEIVPVPER